MKLIVVLRIIANVFINELVFVSVCSYVALFRPQLIPHGEHILCPYFEHPSSINYYRLLSTRV